MQVFDKYTYNLKEIRFKDNKEYCDRLLNDLGLKYTDVGFCFWSDRDGSICDKAIKLFGNLSGYKKYIAPSKPDLVGLQGYRLMSVSEDENGRINMHIDRNHIDDLSGLLKKIPRPINFGFMGVMLDNIDWGDGDSKPCFMPAARGKIVADDHQFRFYYNNGIRFVKEFDYGNKLNIVEVLVERKGDFEQLAPSPQGFVDFCDKLGKPISKSTKCIFNDEERARWQTAHEAVGQMINKGEYDSLFAEYRRDYPQTSQGITQQVLDSLVPIQGFSPKKIFTGVAKKHGYRYRGCTNGRYELKKVNGYNHTTAVSFFAIPFSSLLFAEISVHGYNFDLYVASFPQIIADGEAEFESYAKKVFEIADEIEKKLTEPLFEHYGKTPDWYEA